jgi:hypothetical protein
VVVQSVSRFVAPAIDPDAMLFDLPLAVVGVVGGLAGGLAIALWWLFFSRAAWAERVGAIALVIVALFATSRIVHESIAGGMMGMMLVVYSVPVLSLAFVVWAVATRHLQDGARRAWLVAAILLACAPWALVRTAGVIGAGSEFHWRWTPTPEQRLLAEARYEPRLIDSSRSVPNASASAVPARTPADSSAAATDSSPVARPQAPPSTTSQPAGRAAAETPASGAARSEAGVARGGGPAMSEPRIARLEWPGFRGRDRDGVVHGVRINTDWSASPPVEMWRRAIGPGWSSFAVQGGVLYTQEQRGDDEIVAAYDVATGEPVWRHRDPVRFWESNGGAGPRGTPAISDGRVYAFGATGILNALDAGSGAVVWSRNVASDTGRPVPDWGFASSPLVVDNLVIVAAAGTLAAYDVATGSRRWSGPSYGGSYSSPHRATIDGVDQILLLGGPGAIGVASANGAVLWEHAWVPGAIVQPALLPDGDVLINTIAPTGGMGIRRLAVARGAGGWTVEELWTSSGLKPYFNDFVIHEGHAFGFDGSILACIDMANGRRTWKGGRYGNGQLVLLADQDVLLVLSEEGELALVGATPDQFRELARVPALEGKTWNHPAFVGDVLLVRNGQEMAAFRMPVAGR